MLIVFPIGHLVNDWPGAALWLLAPAMAISMGLSPVEVGLLITIHSAGGSLGYFPAGLIGDCFRNRGNLLAMTFWWVAIGYVIAAETSNFWVVAILLGIAGLGDAAWHPLATGAMVRQMPNRRAQVLGIHALGGTLAEVGAPLCAGILLGYFQWQTVLQLSAVPALIMAFLFLRFRHWVPLSQETSMTRQDLKLMLDIWLRPGSLRTVAIIVLYNMSLMGAMAMMPLYVQQTHGLSFAQTGLLFAVIWIAGALVQPVLGRLSDAMGRKPITVIGLLLAALFLAGASYVASLVWLIPLFVLSLGALVGIRAVLLAAMVDVSDHRATTTLGFAFAMMDGVGALGALLAGLAGQADLRYAFLFAAAVAAGAMILTMTHRFASHPHPPE